MKYINIVKISIQTEYLLNESAFSKRHSRQCKQTDYDFPKC